MTIEKELLPEVNGNRRKYWFVAAIVMLVTYITFIPSLDNEFTNWDDPKYILENHILKDVSWERTLAIFKDEERKAGLYAPLTYLSWAVEHYFYQWDAYYYHRDNVILHVINTGLVFWLIFLLVGRYEAALLTALLFGIHPMHVESVAWITERKDVLYAFFFLLSLILYFQYCSKEKGSRKFYVLCLFVFLLSLLSKPAAVTLPVVLLLIDFFKGRLIRVSVNEGDKPKLNRFVVLEKLPFFALSVLWGYITIQTTQSIAEGDAFSLIERTLFAFYGIATYLFKLILPIHLSCFYPFPTLQENGLLPTIYLIAPLISVALVYGVYRSMARTKTVLFGVLFFLVTIALTLQFIPVGPNIVADRYTYIPYIGLFLIVGQGYVWLTSKQDKKFRVYLTSSKVLIVAFSLWCISLSYQRCDVWANSETLWTDTIEKFPNNYFGYYSRAYGRSAQGEYTSVIRDIDKSIELYPYYVDSYNVRGDAYHKMGKLSKAIADFETAIKLDSLMPDAYSNRGAVQFDLGYVRKAHDDFNKTLEIDPTHVMALVNRANVQAAQGNVEEAELDILKALNINPENIKGNLTYGNLLLTRKQYEKAITFYNRLLSLDENNVNGYFSRGSSKFMTKDTKGACDDWKKAALLGHPQAGKVLAIKCKES